MAIIPQDPVLFSGSLRKNVDVFNEFTDAQVWNALEKAQLKDVVEDRCPDLLDEDVGTAGSKWSAGEKQLICFARAMLSDSEILLLDEATSTVDNKTD